MKSSYKKKGTTVVVNILDLLSPRDKKKAYALIQERDKYKSSIERY